MPRRSRYYGSSRRYSDYAGDGYSGWSPYVPVAERAVQARQEVAKLAKKGHKVCPVRIEGKNIARTFWGKAWCTNLERYSDFENRLPRGRTYVRNGSVIDLQLAAGVITALVSGSRIYTVTIKVKPVSPERWEKLRAGCAGSIESLVELLAGKLSDGVMTRICEPRTGLFPAPNELSLACSCPDWATMCKHVAAVLYGVGARLDDQPELLFKLRGVNELDLVTAAATHLPALPGAPIVSKALGDSDLSEIFGLDFAPPQSPVHEPVPPAPPVAAAGKDPEPSRRLDRQKQAVSGRKQEREARLAAAAARIREEAFAQAAEINRLKGINSPN